MQPTDSARTDTPDCAQRGAHSVLGRVARLAAAVLVAVAAYALAAPGQAGAATTERGVWASTNLTVRVAAEAAWAGTDVQAALNQWSPAVRMTLTDDPSADITLTVAPAPPLVGATAFRSTVRGIIQSCRVEQAESHAGEDSTAVLTHELGHCLGLAHAGLDPDGPTVMWRAAYGPHFSSTVTATDLDNVRSLYR